MSTRVFQVEEEFRIYRLAGMFASNSYYGSARISMAKNEAVNARPGDEIHVLPGGTFLSRPGHVEGCASAGRGERAAVPYCSGHVPS
jgi:hypothetical protein